VAARCSAAASETTLFNVSFGLARSSTACACLGDACPNLVDILFPLRSEPSHPEHCFLPTLRTRAEYLFVF
jgi:hypothetical protein